MISKECFHNLFGYTIKSKSTKKSVKNNAFNDSIEFEITKEEEHTVKSSKNKKFVDCCNG